METGILCKAEEAKVGFVGWNGEGWECLFLLCSAAAIKFKQNRCMLGEFITAATAPSVSSHSSQEVFHYLSWFKEFQCRASLNAVLAILCSKQFSIFPWLSFHPFLEMCGFSKPDMKFSTHIKNWTMFASFAYKTSYGINDAVTL